MVEESYFDDLDRRCLSLSSKMSDFLKSCGMLVGRLAMPLQSNHLQGAASKAKEIGIRCLIAFGTLLGICFAGTYLLLSAVLLAVGSQIFRGVGFYFQKNGFTHIRGSAREKEVTNGQASVMTCNIRRVDTQWHKDRQIGKIADGIKTEDPDVVVLQGVYNSSVESLVSKLGDRYAHFFTYLGPNTWGVESGCMIITKSPVHQFSYTEFLNNDSAVNRGFATFELSDGNFPCVRIIGTDLIPDKGAEEKRNEQIDQVVIALSKQKLKMPTFLVGGLHLGQEETMFSKCLYRPHLAKEPTSSNPIPKVESIGRQESIFFFKRNLPDGRVLPVVERNVGQLDIRWVKGEGAIFADMEAVVTEFILKPMMTPN